LQVSHLQVNRLILGMVGVTVGDVGEAVEGDHAIGLGVLDAWRLVCRQQGHVIGALIVQSPGGDFDADFGQQPALDASHEGAHHVAFFEPLFEVLGSVEFRFEPTGVEGFDVVEQLVMALAQGQALRDALSAQHTGLDRCVAALDAAGIQKAGLTTHHGAARENKARQRQNATGGDGASTVADALAAFEHGFDGGVGFPALHFVKR